MIILNLSKKHFNLNSKSKECMSIKFAYNIWTADRKPMQLWTKYSIVVWNQNFYKDNLGDINLWLFPRYEKKFFWFKTLASKLINHWVFFSVTNLFMRVKIKASWFNLKKSLKLLIKNPYIYDASLRLSLFLIYLKAFCTF